MKHIQDGGDLSLLVDDSGDFVLVCGKCKMTWIGNVPPHQSDAAQDLAPNLAGSLRTHADVLRATGFDVSDLSESLREEGN